eukprot:NODE_994_length_1072_cov_107.442328_g950_i0.p1 GENE.NODE_994_length_1072_cov_107.442328_g950_i0~~NODE_994_length_1072_cov_107.442328_g950_i0.p1  ORF type:complete len:321 (-),score=24.79 NODE_994_length_1072_cov_107.442328_g950_i0:44-1006(-)
MVLSCICNSLPAVPSALEPKLPGFLKGKVAFWTTAAAVAALTSRKIYRELNKQSVRGKLVLVTGASSGIGQAAALLYAKKGARVILAARNSSALEALKTKIEQSGGVAYVRCMDCSKAAEVKAASSLILDQIGVPDIIVNCAGAGVWKFVEQTSYSEVSQCMDAPFFAAANVTLAFSSHMIKRRSGMIVQVNSPACVAPWPGCIGYAAARAALYGWHNALVMDLSGTGVKPVHVILGETSSGYWAANDVGSHQLPKIGKWLLPQMTPAQAAAVVVSASEYGDKEVTRPLMLSIIRELRTFMPDTVDWLVKATSIGRKLPS